MGIAAGRVFPHRYFSGAPFEETSFYEIHAKLDGKFLSPEAILERWEMNYSGRNNRSIHHIISVIRWCEKRAIHPADVQLEFRTNGGQKQVWKWAEDNIFSTE